MGHLREYIRTRSSRANLPGFRADKNRVRARVAARQYAMLYDLRNLSGQVRHLAWCWGRGAKKIKFNFRAGTALWVPPCRVLCTYQKCSPRLGIEKAPNNSAVSVTTASPFKSTREPRATQLTAALVRCTGEAATLPAH